MALPRLKLQTSRSSSPQDDELRASLGEHLEELRQRVFRAVGWLLVGMVAGWFIQDSIYNTVSGLVQAAAPEGLIYEEAFGSFQEGFMLRLKLSFYVGLVLSIPFIAMEIWGFLKPGLKPQERRPLTYVVPASVALFALGAFLCWTVLPYSIQFLMNFMLGFSDAKLIQAPGSMVVFVAQMMLAFGVGFQMPLLVFALTKLGILSTKTLLRYWRHWSIGVFIISALLTPGGDPQSLFILAVPLIGLFFLSAGLARLTSRKSARTDALDDLD